MTVFRAYFKVAKKFANSLIGYTVIFTVLMIIMMANRSNTTTEDFIDQGIDLSIINHDDNDITDKFIAYLETKHHRVEVEENEDSFRDAIYNRTVSYILIIPEGFGESLLSDNTMELGSYKLPGSLSSNFFEMDMNSFLDTYRTYLSFGMDSKDAYATTINTLSKEADASIRDSVVDDSDKDTHYFFIYYTYIIMSLLITGLAPVLIQFNQSDLKKRTLCGPISIGKRSLALTFGSSIYVILIYAFFMILGLILCKGEMLHMVNTIRLLNAFVYSLVCLAISFLLSTLLTKITALNMFANILGLGSSFLCGVFVPRELLGENVLRIGRFLPAYWYVNIETELSQNGLVINNTVLIGFGIQLLFFLVLMAIALTVGKVKRK